MNGSYSSSSSSFANLRTYHGLFVKRIGDKYERLVILSKLFEELVVKGNKFNIDTNYYKDAIYPEGYRTLSSFELGYIPTFHFKVEGLSITKSLVMDPENDWLMIKYDFDGQLPSSFFLHPLFALRSYHLAMKRRDLNLSIDNLDGVYEFRSGDNFLKIMVDGSFVPDDTWYYNFQYPLDMKRGSNYEEDLYHPGYFKIDNPSASLEVKISCSEGMPEDFKMVKDRMMMAQSASNSELKSIVGNSTVFLVNDDVIAGFYWFGPWTRDTMISMPGLILVTKRFRLARKILGKYAQMINDGMMPVTVTDPANISSADSSLWFIYALYKYYKYTGDINTVKRVYPAVMKIIKSYIKGNELIELDGCLVKAKKPGITWMDARTGDMIFTARTGLPVEVNALWYNALASAEYFSRELNLKFPKDVNQMIPAIKEEFKERFVTNDQVLDIAGPDDSSIRPNFLLSFSLPFPIMNNFSRYSLAVKTKLLTHYGLRSLSSDDPKYVGKYEGDQYHRDMAYHNGSVWPWLVGPYITASVRSGTSRDELLAYFKPLLSLRMIPEIFDGDEPHEPRGCIMQAWSYGEIIRAYYEDLASV